MSSQIDKAITTAWSANEDADTKSKETATWGAQINKYHSYFKNLKMSLPKFQPPPLPNVRVPNKEQNQHFEIASPFLGLNVSPKVYVMETQSPVQHCLEVEIFRSLYALRNLSS